MPEPATSQLPAEDLIRSHGLPISDDEALVFSFLGDLLRSMTESLYRASLVDEL